MMPYTPMSAAPAKDGRTVTDDRIQEETPTSQGTTHQYVSTADGDVQTLVVEPSFDGSEKEGQKKHHREPSWQGVRATEEGKSAPPERSRSSPTETEGKAASHARNLSSHFYDAATISAAEPPTAAAPGVSFDEQSQRSGYPVQHSVGRPSASPTSGVPPVSPAVGQKHSRAYSGDMSNPAFAHRRIDSMGSSAQVGRQFYGSDYPPQAPQESRHPFASASRGSHHREGSAGLDILTAAIRATDVSKEELAKAAGKPSPAHQPDVPEQPAEPPREGRPSPPQEEAMTRSSPPNEMGSRPYSYPQGGAMGAPRFRPPPQGGHADYQQRQHGYQPGSYPPQAYYQGQGYYPPQAYHQRQMSHGQHMGYPTQYAPSSRGHAGYADASFAPPPHQPPTRTRSSGEPAVHQRAESSGKIDTDEPLFANRNMQYQGWGGPPRPGTSTGVQTFVTTMSVGDVNKTMHPAATHKTAGTSTDPSSSDQQHPAIPSTVGHHRKLSSFSSLSTILGSGVFPEDQQSAQGKPGSSYFHNPTDQMTRPPAAATGAPHAAPSGHHRKTSSSLSFLNALDEKTVTGRGHHRSTSSSVSFLHGLDNFDPNDAFTSPLDGQPNAFFGPNTSNTSPYGAPAQKPPYTGAQYGGPPRPHDAQSSSVCVPIMVQNPQPSAPVPAPAAEASNKSSTGLAAGGTSKRVRRKCTVAGCPNRVVQGGLCISHGAKRKQCKHPGCTKNVKKAGLCSTHGPARKRCEAEGCQKVAVQGGRCIAHGAKKKLCKMDGCNKQAILAGMCKKHHDQSTGVASGGRGSDSSGRDPSPPIDVALTKPVASRSRGKKPSHTRGLSIFQEVSPENIQTILDPGAPPQGPQDGRGPEDAYGYNDRMM